MPYDENQIAQMRAELLNRYGPSERPEVYDDGQSLLGQNPDMIPVGFKVPKLFDIPHNPSRRNMGLDLPNAPAGKEIAPMTPTPFQQPSALEAIKNLPMTRRKVLQTPVNAAISHLGKGLVGEAVAPVVESAIARTAPEEAQSSFVRNPLFDEYLENYAGAHVTNISENLPEEAEQLIYPMLRPYLKDRVPEKYLQKYDDLFDEVDMVDEDGELLESSIDAQIELGKMIDDNLKHLKPKELHMLINEMSQYETDVGEFADDLLRNAGNAGYEDIDVQTQRQNLIDYLQNSWNEK